MRPAEVRIRQGHRTPAIPSGPSRPHPAVPGGPRIDGAEVHDLIVDTAYRPSDQHRYARDWRSVEPGHRLPVRLRVDPQPGDGFIARPVAAGSAPERIQAPGVLRADLVVGPGSHLEIR